jgi:putative transposase
MAAWIAKWANRYPRLIAWAEENNEETLTSYRRPRQHHRHLKSTNMLERLNKEFPGKIDRDGTWQRAIIFP